MHAFQITIIKQTRSWMNGCLSIRNILQALPPSGFIKKHWIRRFRAGDGAVACFKKLSSVLICHNRPLCSIDFTPPPSPDTRSSPHSTDLYFPVFSSRIFSAVQISSRDKLSARVGYSKSASLPEEFQAHRNQNKADCFTNQKEPRFHSYILIQVDLCAERLIERNWIGQSKNWTLKVAFNC